MSTGNGAYHTFDLSCVCLVAQQTVAVQSAQPTKYFAGGSDLMGGKTRRTSHRRLMPQCHSLGRPRVNRKALAAGDGRENVAHNHRRLSALPLSFVAPFRGLPQATCYAGGS